jgi:hypothetical protein
LIHFIVLRGGALGRRRVGGHGVLVTVHLMKGMAYRSMSPISDEQGN